MNFISKLFKKKEEETEVVSKGSVEEFVTLIRVYYIRYWNYSGRDMLWKGIYNINHES